MKEYMLIFRHQNGSKIASPEQIEQWMQATKDWISGIAAQGKYVGGEGFFFDDAKVVHHGGIVKDGAFGELNETLGGYVTVKADSVDEAIEFAKGSPVLAGEHNTVEVRMLAKG